MNRYYTVNEIASELGLSTRTIYRMLEAGLLKGIKTGRVWRVSRSDLGAYLSLKSNPEPLVPSAHSAYIADEPVRPFEELAWRKRKSARVSTCRVILERQLDSGTSERFELPLEIRERAGSFIIKLKNDHSPGLEIAKPAPTRLAIQFFLQSEPALWLRVKDYFPTGGGVCDWKAAFNLEGLNKLESAALKWAYNLDDSASRPVIEKAVVADRLTLLAELGPEHRRAALASLKLLFDNYGSDCCDE